VSSWAARLALPASALTLGRLSLNSCPLFRFEGRKPSGRFRPDYAALDRHRAQDRTFGFAPVSVTQLKPESLFDRTA
jgi:hypothetical protein